MTQWRTAATVAVAANGRRRANPTSTGPDKADTPDAAPTDVQTHNTEAPTDRQTLHTHTSTDQQTQDIPIETSAATVAPRRTARSHAAPERYGSWVPK